MNSDPYGKQTDGMPKQYIVDVSQKAMENRNFCTTIWIGSYVQMTLMCIPVCSDVGLEVHISTDQIIRIEQGNAIVKMGDCKNHLDFQEKVCVGDTIFVPAKYPMGEERFLIKQLLGKEISKEEYPTEQRLSMQRRELISSRKRQRYLRILFVL